jgi:hypothetical protein
VPLKKTRKIKEGEKEEIKQLKRTIEKRVTEKK